MKIKTKSGIEDFDTTKIVDSINAACIKAISEKDTINFNFIANKIAMELIDCHEPTTEKVSQLIGEYLYDAGYEKVAQQYVQLSISKNSEIERNSSLFREINGLLEGTNTAVMNENANKNAFEFPTKRDLLAGIVSKHMALNHILQPYMAEAHRSGDIHIHDLDYSPAMTMFNCMLIDIPGMLSKGYKLGNAQVNPPRSIGVACAQVAQIIARVSSCIYGGCTVADIDIALEPYVRASKRKIEDFVFKNVELGNRKRVIKEMLEKEVYDAFQALEYEVNTLYSSNGQTPFVTFGFGNGNTEYSKMIQEAILKVRIKGLGRNGITPVFPKLIFKISKGHNYKEGQPFYSVKKLALECASKRIYPDILNGAMVTPMGCRSFLHAYTPMNGGGKQWNGRNNLGVITLNLPRIAIEAKGNVNAFFNLLDKQLEIVHAVHRQRLAAFEQVKAKHAPILYMEGACGVRLGPEENVAKIFKDGRASVSVGYIGINEMCNALYGNDEHIFDSRQKKAFAEKVVHWINTEIRNWFHRDGYKYSLYSTPSENLCDRLLRLDREKYGVIPGVTDRDYYTNSFHLDPALKVSPFEKIEFEKDYHCFATGGHITYVELPSMVNNLEGLEQIWDFALDNVPYFGVNMPVDKCGACGFEGEADITDNGFKCPSCDIIDARLNVTRRICGYLGNPVERPVIHGKHAEFKDRTKHC